MTFLPIAAVVAICLFLAKEIAEFVRRRGERKRKKAAIKEVLRHEVAYNYRVLLNLFSALDDTTRDEIEPEGSDVIVVQHGGRLRYHRLDPNGAIVSGLPLLSVCTTEFNKILPTVAELDKNLYAEIRLGYQFIYEIEHLWTSFVDYLTGDPAEREQWFDGFRHYAEECKDGITEGVEQLYKVLTGEDLPNRRIGNSLADAH